ncbi:hypothetical protein HanRHA438_Chr10g0447241 [Helianthus annuus]|nr:hypothetical protein HanRHA438_Chr10g0447241 [Helianthus annuus]
MIYEIGQTLYQVVFRPFIPQEHNFCCPYNSILGFIATIHSSIYQALIIIHVMIFIFVDFFYISQLFVVFIIYIYI